MAVLSVEAEALLEAESAVGTVATVLPSAGGAGGAAVVVFADADAAALALTPKI